MEVKFNDTAAGGGQLTAFIPFESELAKPDTREFWVGLTDSAGNLLGQMRFERSVVIGTTVCFAATELRPATAEGLHPPLVKSIVLARLRGGP